MKTNKKNQSSVKSETHLPKKEQQMVVPSLINSTSELIRFDPKTRNYIFLLLALYVLCVFFKLNGSAVGMWNQILPAEGIAKKTGIIAGTAKSIRSDEWLGQVPFHVSQYNNGFGSQNPTMGPLNTPLMWNMPNHFWVNVLKPSYWGSFVLDMEREFSYFWCFRIFVPLISFFLFFMLVTKNNFVLSVFGSFWLFLTSTNQWWSLYIGEMAGYLALIFVCMAYLLYSQDKKALIVSAIFFLLSSFSFITGFYPAWQVPLIYVTAALSIGYFLDNFPVNLKDNWKFRSSIIIVTLGVLFLALFLLYFNIKETAAIMTSTKYPGIRFSVGGSIKIVQIFTAYFSPFISEIKLPTQWGNISEISKFLMFFPVPLYFTVRGFIVKKRVSYTLILLSIVSLFFIYYMIIGFPRWLSLATLLKFTPEDRLMAPFGVLNLIMTIIFLSESELSKIRLTVAEKYGALTGFLVLGSYVLIENNNLVNGFFKSGQVLAIILFLTITSFSLIFTSFKWRVLVFSVVVIGYLFTNLYAVNPINSGIPVFTKHPLIPIIKDIQQKEKDAGWAVFGSFIIPSYLKAFNLKVINGLETMPDYKKLSVLDPELKHDSVYNRYGYMNMASYVNNDSIIFQLQQPDLYTIALDPCSNRLKQLGVKYMIFAYQPQPVEIRCMSLISNSVIPIYRLND